MELTVTLAVIKKNVPSLSIEANIFPTNCDRSTTNYDKKALINKKPRPSLISRTARY